MFVFLGKMYLFVRKIQIKKDILNNSKKFESSEKYNNKPHQLMEQIIKNSDDRDDNEIKGFNNNEVIKIYKRF